MGYIFFFCIFRPPHSCVGRFMRGIGNRRGKKKEREKERGKGQERERDASTLLLYFVVAKREYGLELTASTSGGLGDAGYFFDPFCFLHTVCRPGTHSRGGGTGWRWNFPGTVLAVPVVFFFSMFLSCWPFFVYLLPLSRASCLTSCVAMKNTRPHVFADAASQVWRLFFGSGGIRGVCDANVLRSVHVCILRLCFPGSPPLDSEAACGWCRGEGVYKTCFGLCVP